MNAPDNVPYRRPITEPCAWKADELRREAFAALLNEEITWEKEQDELLNKIRQGEDWGRPASDPQILSSPPTVL